MLEDLRELVDAYMVARLSDPQVLSHLGAQLDDSDDRAQDIMARITKDEDRLKALQAELDDGEADEIPEVVKAIRSVRQRLQDARRELADLTTSPDLAMLDFPALAAAWQSLHIDEKQRLLRLFVERVEIGPAQRGLGRFDPDRVDIVPRIGARLLMR